MKKLLGILALGLLIYTTPSKAIDLRDFQIEGISILDSATDHFSIDKIKNNTRNYFKNNKFTPVDFEINSSEMYSAIQFAFATNDNQFKITSLNGIIDFPNNIDKCNSKKNEIVSQISDLVKGFSKKIDTGVQQHPADKHSSYSEIRFELDSGDNIYIKCTDWSDQIGYTDHLKVGIETKEFHDWYHNIGYYISK